MSADASENSAGNVMLFDHPDGEGIIMHDDDSFDDLSIDIGDIYAILDEEPIQFSQVNSFLSISLSRYNWIHWFFFHWTTAVVFII